MVFIVIFLEVIFTELDSLKRCIFLSKRFVFLSENFLLLVLIAIVFILSGRILSYQKLTQSIDLEFSWIDGSLVQRFVF